MALFLGVSLGDNITHTGPLFLDLRQNKHNTNKMKTQETSNAIHSDNDQNANNLHGIK